MTRECECYKPPKAPNSRGPSGRPRPQKPSREGAPPAKCAAKCSSSLFVRWGNSKALSRFAAEGGASKSRCRPAIAMGAAKTRGAAAQSVVPGRQRSQKPSGNRRGLHTLSTSAWDGARAMALRRSRSSGGACSRVRCTACPFESASLERRHTRRALSSYPSGHSARRSYST